MPFLDILITPGRDGSLSTYVYRKPTHTDLHLQWDSHHTLNIKIQHDWDTATQSTNHLLQPTTPAEGRTTPEECTQEPTWALNRIQMKTKKQDSKQVPYQQNQ